MQSVNTHVGRQVGWQAGRQVGRQVGRYIEMVQRPFGQSIMAEKSFFHTHQTYKSIGTLASRGLHRLISALWQCDPMAQLLLPYLAIYNDKKLPNCIKLLIKKINSKFLPKCQINIQKNYHSHFCGNFAKSGHTSPQTFYYRSGF